MMNQRIRDRISIHVNGFPDQSQFIEPKRKEKVRIVQVAANEHVYPEPMRFYETRGWFQDFRGYYWTYEHLRMRHGEI